MTDSSTAKSSNSFLVITIWIVILVAFSWFFKYLLDNLYNPNQKIVSQVNELGNPEVTLLRNRSGHYIANGEINGQEVTFLLDTGATHVSIPEGIANKLGLKKGRPTQVQTANGVITTYASRLDSVSIGNIRIDGVRAGINPYMDGGAALLGMSFLKHLELTQRGDTLKIAIP